MDDDEVGNAIQFHVQQVDRRMSPSRGRSNKCAQWRNRREYYGKRATTLSSVLKRSNSTPSAIRASHGGRRTWTRGPSRTWRATAT
jgi:hypothetical protein